MKSLSWKFVFVVLVMVVSVLYVMPTIVMYSSGTKTPEMWPNKKINLGLDLQGGMHLVLEVEAQKAVESTMERKTYDIKKILRTKHIRNKGVLRKAGTAVIEVKLMSSDDASKFESILKDSFQDLKISSNSVKAGGSIYQIEMVEKSQERIKKSAVDQALETIRNRIDAFGVSEPDIRRQGERSIQIQLPGITDTKSAKELLTGTAVLEFKLLDETHSIANALDSNPPPGTEILYESRMDNATGTKKQIPYLIKKRALLTGDSLTDARVSIDSQDGQPYVSIEFDSRGGKIFSKITGENIGKRLAIVLDNKVYSAPTIQSKIAHGSARITGSFTMDEAKVLAIALRAGALPAPVKIMEERTVGPTLGADSIHKGLFSMIIGGICVIIFMLIYYNGSGLIADVALVVNILLIAAGLAMLQATLTLPGIAGIILTIGMAVDSNVLIYERIREELLLGQTPAGAIAAGFEKATLTILDANVTTLIAAIVLFQFGSGPVKGFAVTLGLGIVSSLFTALIISRMIFDFFLDKVKIKSLSI